MDSGPIHYLAFGSNMHPLRLQERVPSARLLGPVTLTGYRLAFHKLGGDGSGKGNLVHTGAEADRAIGALYRMAGTEKPALDAAEGAGYRDAAMTVPFASESVEALVYIAEAAYVDPQLRPYRWYRDIVWYGAHYLGAPADYLATIAAVPAITDPDPERRADNWARLERIRTYEAAASP